MVIESIPKAVGMGFAVLVSLLVGLLLLRGKFNRRIGYVLLAASTLMGFLVYAPMLPNQFQVLLLGKTRQLGVPVPIAGVVLFLFVAMTFALGRSFCGYACPIGAVQELVFLLPGRKLRIKNRSISLAFRLISLVVFLVLALGFSIGMLRYLGSRDFFYLEITGLFFFVFLALVVLGIFLYRPFCRFLCPYGTILSLAATKGLFRLRRNDECNECGECELVCPTDEAGAADLKQECYLCHRCVEACKRRSISYSRSGSAGG